MAACEELKGSTFAFGWERGVGCRWLVPWDRFAPSQAPYPQVYEIPFLVALDHRKEAVVVAVRGTMSMQVRILGMGVGQRS